MNKWTFEDGDYLTCEQCKNSRTGEWNGKLRFLQHNNIGLIKNILECRKEDATEIMSEYGLADQPIAKGEQFLELEYIPAPEVEEILPVWGHDNEGDLALRVDDKVYVFYKWANPIVREYKEEEFIPLTDENSKDYWRASKKDS